MNEAREALERVFGFAGFRPGQQEILEAVFAGENILAVMPTGSGKSLAINYPLSCAGVSPSSSRL
jgi:ATP-dependent DNA helicase RecQ